MAVHKGDTRLPGLVNGMRIGPGLIRLFSFSATNFLALGLSGMQNGVDSAVWTNEPLGAECVEGEEVEAVALVGGNADICKVIGTLVQTCCDGTTGGSRSKCRA